MYITHQGFVSLCEVRNDGSRHCRRRLPLGVISLGNGMDSCSGEMVLYKLHSFEIPQDRFSLAALMMCITEGRATRGGTEERGGGSRPMVSYAL